MCIKHICLLKFLFLIIANHSDAGLVVNFRFRSSVYMQVFDVVDGLTIPIQVTPFIDGTVSELLRVFPSTN